MDDFSRSERQRHSEEDILAVLDVFTEKDREKHLIIFENLLWFDEWRELASWSELEHSADVAPIDNREDDDDALHPLAQPVYVLSFGTDHADCEDDVLKWLLFNDRLLPLLALFRRCPSYFHSYSYRLLRNKHNGAKLEYPLYIFLLRLYIYLNLVIAFGETAGRGRVSVREDRREGDSPYHDEFTDFLLSYTPHTSDASADPILNEFLCHFWFIESLLFGRQVV